MHTNPSQTNVSKIVNKVHILHTEDMNKTRTEIEQDGLDQQTALNILVDYLLGENWYISDPVGGKQGNAIIVDTILKKYSRKYRRELQQEKNLENYTNRLANKLKRRVKRAKGINFLRIQTDNTGLIVEKVECIKGAKLAAIGNSSELQNSQKGKN